MFASIYFNQHGPVLSAHAFTVATTNCSTGCAFQVWRSMLISEITVPLDHRQ